MEIALAVFTIVVLGLWFWISAIAILCLFLDPDLEIVQRWGQTFAVVLLPLIGASLVLKLVNDHSPEVIRKFYIPWPFNLLVLDTELLSDGPGSNKEEVTGGHRVGGREARGSSGESSGGGD
ncbi:hypothetical protein ACMXYV_08615 [Neptuniibacter sp. SY11_33]|uniref:hypothetical protein n=1 Tax=Neptuniibacter sp. SY11_33 TaxID=3398215 RepID=UPI0039F47937